MHTLLTLHAYLLTCTLTYTCFRLWNAHVLPARQVSASKCLCNHLHFVAGKAYGASGVTWLRIGGANGTQQLQPSSGFRLLNNSQLSHALLRKREFPPHEWALWDIKDLRADHVIKSGEYYYRPFDQALLRGLRGPDSAQNRDSRLLQSLKAGSAPRAGGQAYVLKESVPYGVCSAKSMYVMCRYMYVCMYVYMYVCIYIYI